MAEKAHIVAGKGKPAPLPAHLPAGPPPIPLGVPCQMPNLMVVLLLGDEEIQREEAQEDNDGGEGRGSQELETEGRMSGDSCRSPTADSEEFGQHQQLGPEACPWF